MRTAAPAGSPSPSRWALWLVSGAAAGLVVGFVLGLARPRPTATSTTWARAT